MRLFLAIATDSSLLDVVALRALAGGDDQVLVITDAYARERGQARRFMASLQRLSLIAREVVVQDWNPATIDAAMQEAVKPALGAEGRPEDVQLLLIAGRTHDWALLQAVLTKLLKKVGIPLRGISVDRRPPCIRISNLTDPLASDGNQRIYLADLPAEKRLGLEDVLAVRGYARTRGSKVEPQGRLPAGTIAGSGDGFETYVLSAVRKALTSSPLGRYVTEIWSGVEVTEAGAKVILTEFDALLLACDGSVVHFECKVGKASDMQKKVFQMRRIFTTESQIALCRNLLNSPTAQQVADTRRTLKHQFENLGHFGLVLASTNLPHDMPVQDGEPSVLQGIVTVLEKAWQPRTPAPAAAIRSELENALTATK